VKAILDHENTDISIQDKGGWTALHHACSCNSADIIKLLFASSFKAALRTVDTGTCLIVAVESGHLQCVKELLQEVPGIDVNRKDSSGNAALILACKLGHRSIAELLLQHPSIDATCSSKYLLDKYQPTKEVARAIVKYAELQITENLQLILSDDPAQQLKATRHFRRLVSIHLHPPIKEVIESGIVIPRLVQFLQLQDQPSLQFKSVWDKPSLQFESAWALTNISSGTSEQTHKVVESGAVPIFIALLQSSSEDIRDRVVCALGNIAGNSVKSRDLVLSLGALPALIGVVHSFIEHSRLSAIRKAAWSLSNLCRNKPPPDFTITRQALPLLSRLIYSKDPETVTNACWALSYLSEGSNDHIAALIEAGIAPRLIELLESSQTTVHAPALRTVGNMVTGSDSQTQTIIDLNVLPALLLMLDYPTKNIRKEACWTISNITAGTDTQIQAVIDCGIFRKIIELLESAELAIQQEAAWTVSNATAGGNPQQILYIAQQGASPLLCSMLKVSDQITVVVALKALENFLEAAEGELLDFVRKVTEDCDGLEMILNLRSHQHNDILARSTRIVENYFKN
jgi:HEAT repeat protein